MNRITKSKEMPVYLFHQGTNAHAWELLGAHRQLNGKITVNMQIDKHGRILLRGNGFPTVYHLGRKKASRGHLLAGVHHFVPKHRQNVCYL